MAHIKTNATPSTAQQLFRVIRHERASFPLTLLKNSFTYSAHKYLLRQQYLVKKIHGYNMKIDLQDPGISRSLLLVGDREREHQFMLKRAVKPNQTILDLGANIGYYVLMEHQLLAGTGSVIAIEPSPCNYQALCENIRLNDQEKSTTLVNAAITDFDGKVDLHLSQLSNVHSLVKSQVPSPTNQTIKVDAISLQTIAKQYPGIKLIRMDIEGYEQTILNSLAEINQHQNFKPSILFELHPPKYDPSQFATTLASLHKLGYHAELVATSHLELLRQSSLNPIASIPTDGTIRHIAEHVPLASLLKLFMKSRAVLLSPTGN